MTSANVTQAAGLFLDAVGAGTMNNIAGAADSGFSQVMDRTKQELGNQAGEMSGENRREVKTPVKVERTNVRKAESQESKVSEAEQNSETEKSALAETKEAESTEGNTEKVDEAVQEALEEAAAEIAEAVKEELGLTDEELNTILETLGLSQMDLLNVENIQAIVVATTGETDGLSILIDENLYQSLQQLTEVVETTVADLQNQLQVDETGFGD